jgi:hypothetical protein
VHAAHQLKRIAVKLTADALLAKANAKVVVMPLQSFNVGHIRKIVNRFKFEDDFFQSFSIIRG